MNLQRMKMKAGEEKGREVKKMECITEAWTGGFATDEGTVYHDLPDWIKVQQGDEFGTSTCRFGRRGIFREGREIYTLHQAGIWK